MNKPKFDPNKPYSVSQDSKKPKFDPNQPFEESPVASQPKVGSMIGQMASQAIGQTPLGMAAQGMGSIQRGVESLTVPFIRTPESLQKPISALFRGSRSLGVGGALNTLTGNTPQALMNTAQRMREAYQPGYQPANRTESVGAYLGQNAPVIAATALSPAVGAPLAMAGQQIAETGKFSPVVAGSAAIPLLGKASGSLAIGQARRALGFNKGMLKTPFARGQAQMAAQTALDEGVIARPSIFHPIKSMNSPQRMLDRATGIAASEGEKIGAVLSKTPTNYEASISNLDKLRGELTQGLDEGVYKRVNSSIDNIKNSISEMDARTNPSYGLVPRQSTNTSVTSLNSLKNRIGKSINYLADAASQSDNKAIVNNLANTIRDTVKNYIPPDEFVSFLKSQRLYNAAELMQKALNNEVASQMSNMPVSLPSTVAGAGMMATGNIPKAVATSGLFEGFKRFGAAPLARSMSDFSKGSKAISGAMTGTMLGNILTPELARQYLAKAKGDPNEARRMATSDGWRIPKK